MSGLFPLVFLFAGLCFLLPAGVQGTGPSFRAALPGRVYRFPEDHFVHPRFRTEWWYYTGHLQTAEGRSYGYELTFFRHRFGFAEERKSRWAADTLYFAHFALTDEGAGTFFYAERTSRPIFGQAGGATDRYRVWVGDWSVQGEEEVHHLQAREQRYAIDLFLTPQKPPVIHGEEGISRKGTAPENASHYYSYTRMQTRGTLWIGGKPLAVTGLSWMDHEFMSNQLEPDQVGWDWFSMQLDNRQEIMLYLIRYQDPQRPPFASGTLVYADGTWRHLSAGDFSVQVLDWWTSAKSGARYPIRWRVTVPAEAIRLTLTPTVKDQELDTSASTGVIYWEGSVRITGTRRGEPLAGKGYVEMTGYASLLTRRMD
ncbi:MAG: carotenoid 1,2-hydratase [Nitrospinota bacterium]|nr:MAG: carotenoid 1,2-hydratase [Nitrospinota bacterium]